MIINYVLTLIIICTLTACDKNVKGTDSRIKPVSCENSFAITDYNQVWLFDYKPNEGEIFESLYLKYAQRSSASQVNYLCQTKELAIGFTYRGKSGKDAGIEFISENGVSNVGLNPDGFNAMIPFGSQLFVYTTLMKRSKIDPNIGFIMPDEYVKMPHPGLKESNAPLSNSSDHIYIDLLSVNLNNHSVNKRFRFPTTAAIPVWADQDNIVLFGSLPLTINTNNGFRNKAMNIFNDSPYFRQFNAHFHYYNGTFYAVVSSSHDDAMNKNNVAPNSIYILNNVSGNWDKCASFNFAPIHSTGIQDEIVIFGRDSFARFDISKNRLTVEKRNFDGMIATACAGVKDGRVVIMSYPDTRPNTYLGGEIWIYDADWKKVRIKQKLKNIGLPNITSQLSPFPSGVSYNSF